MKGSRNKNVLRVFEELGEFGMCLCVNVSVKVIQSRGTLLMRYILDLNVHSSDEQSLTEQAF